VRPAALGYRTARKLAIAIVGGTLLLLGVLMLVLPGPAVLVIPAGLGVLAIEFTWARRLLERARRRLAEAAQRAEPEARGDGGAGAARAQAGPG
jgi:tellurite resistance protein TerC